MASKKSNEIEKTKKLIIIGDPMCGKTSLLYALKTKQFNENGRLPIFETPVIPVEINEKTIHIALFHTDGYEQFERFRSLSYYGTDVVLICFSVDNPMSAQNIIKQWGPEIRHYCHRCPIIVVGCKKDLRTITELDKLVSSQMGRRIAAQIKADGYMECSSKTGEGIDNLLTQAAHLSIRPHSNRSRTCQCILQ